MKHCVLLSMLLALGCVHVHGAPVEAAMEPGSCKDAHVLGAADLALNEINKDRQEGYVFALHGLSNAHMSSHGASGHVFYLTLDVVETNCSVLSKKSYKECEVRDTASTPVYGECKVVIYISKIHRVVHLYTYNCVVRPVPAAKVHETCPDCPSHIAFDHAEVQSTVSTSLEKFNKESGLTNHFSLLNITRATTGMAVGMYYHVEFTIKETDCAKGTAAADKCPFMNCEFAHNGFCKGSMYPTPTGESVHDVECEIYEPEASHKELKAHLSDATEHVHAPSDPTAAADNAGAADHAHHGHTHSHAHSHDNVHAHHDKAHDHSGDSANKHHNYKHADGEHTHDHDHEIALDHDHKHTHLHTHEHHHHHHTHDHKAAAHDPEGLWHVLPAMDQPATLTSFPDMPAAGPGPEVPGEEAVVLLPFPTAFSAECAHAAPGEDSTLVEKLFAEDPMFKTA